MNTIIVSKYYSETANNALDKRIIKLLTWVNCACLPEVSRKEREWLKERLMEIEQ